jgi:predicted ATPase/transcriptional regulator with XRE-family HTH domain
VTVAQTGSFGSQLRALREAAGLSQEELAERAHISSHAVSALERGTRTRPYPYTIRALADALAVTEDQRAALVAAVPARRPSSRGPADAPRSDRAWSLPRPATPLRGRETDVDRVVRLLREPQNRLVTLTGTGGVGKTRLGVAVADAVAPAFGGAVCLVELAPLLHADAVLPAIVDAVDARSTDDHDPVRSISEHLADQQVLLLLDNVEHLLDAAPSIARLIETTPGLTVLATSRAPLRIRGESEVPIEPLALPADAAPELVSASPAVRLFLERARAVAPGWGHDDDLEAVAAISTRLAGIPLALELTAARARLLDPAMLLARLDQSALDGARDLPARQRTMRAALDWSYGLLTPDEQALLRLLSVFAAGFRIDDLEAVAARSGMVPPEDVLPLLQSLVEQSLVVGESPDGLPQRHRLLEPIAQYARDKLLAAGESDAASRAHADHFLALAEEAAPQYQRADQVAWLARIDAEHPNLTAASQRYLATGNAGEAARLGWALWLYWWLRGHLVHGRRQMEAVLTHELPSDLRARADLAAATMAFAMDDLDASRRSWSAAAAHSAGTPDLVSQANAIAGLGLAALASGDLDAARQSFIEAAPIAEAAGAPGEWTAALNQIWLGTIGRLTGDLTGAVDHIDRGLASARRRGDRLTSYVALYNLAQVEVTRGRPDVARRHLADGMRMSLETGDLANLAYFLDASAVLEAAGDVHARVPLLFGAAQAIRESIGTRGYGYYRPDPEAGAKAVDEARRHLGDDRYDDALDMGRRMPPDEAVALALGERTKPD